MHTTTFGGWFYVHHGISQRGQKKTNMKVLHTIWLPTSTSVFAFTSLSSLSFPAEADAAIKQEKFRELYEQARREHPARWSRSCRNWNPVELVELNPGRPVMEVTNQAA